MTNSVGVSHWKTTDPIIVRNIRENARRHREHVKNLHWFEDSHQVIVAFVREKTTGASKPVGVFERPGVGDLPGHWLRPNHGVKAPEPSNRAARRLLKEVEYSPLPVAGMPAIYAQDGRDCRTMVFVQGNTAFAQTGESKNVDCGLWQRIVPDEYETAFKRNLFVQTS